MATKFFKRKKVTFNTSHLCNNDYKKVQGIINTQEKRGVIIVTPRSCKKSNQ